MIAWIVRFILGSTEVSCGERALVGVLDAMMHAEIPYDNLHRDGSGRGCFRVFRTDRDRVFSVCQDGSDLRVEREGGLPHLLYRYRKRVGIPIGALLFAWILWMSSHVIWSIDVSGNQTVSDTVIKERLEQLGCGVGSYIPHLDLWQICNRYLLYSDDLVFISVNLEGTVAHVEVMERQEKEESDWETPNDDTPSNLVASCDGQIVRYEVSSGQAVVKVHDVVRKGELLVSGIVNTKKNPDNTFRLERAVGRVYAQTRRQFSVSVPLESKQTEVIREEMVEKSVIFFGFPLKVFKKGGKIQGEYDIIKEKTRWELFRTWPLLKSVSLPIETERVMRVQYTERTVVLSEEEALERAYEQLWAQYSAVFCDKEVLRYEVSESLSADGRAVELSMWVECIENIATEVPIALADITVTEE